MGGKLKKSDVRFPWLRSVIETGASRSVQLVAIVYASRADYDTGCNAWPSLPTVAKDAGVGLRTAKRAVKWLEDVGWLERTGWRAVEYSPRQRTIVYRLTTPDAVPGTQECGTASGADAGSETRESDTASDSDGDSTECQIDP
jgi:hypothetical protein